MMLSSDTTPQTNDRASAADVMTAGLVKEYRSRKRTHAIGRLIAQIVIAVLILASWEFTSRFLVDSFWISSPTAVAARTWEWASTGFIVPHILITLQEMLLGLVAGTILGLVAGIVLGINVPLDRVLNPYVMVAFVIPHLALMPLLILAFGIGVESKIILVTIVSFFFIFYNTLAGIRDVNVDVVNQVRIMGAGQLRVIRSVLLPSATGWIITGMRLAIRQALAAAVVGEMLAASLGLGFLLSFSSGTFDSTGVFTALVFITIIAVILNAIASLVERHLTRWKATSVGA